MQQINKKQYRLGAGIILLKQNTGILAGKRRETSSHSWQMPQGGIDNNEDPYDAAIRELYEETSIKSIKLINSTKNWISYDIPKQFLPQFWNGKYVGQKQRWFLMEFTGDDSEINVFTKEPEFIDWKWSNPSKLITETVVFKQELYKKLFSYFNI